MKRVAINARLSGGGSPLSPGVVAEPFLFVSGQIGVDPATGSLAGDTVETQTEQVLRNLADVLSAGGLSMEDVVKTTVFLTRIEDFAPMNGVYRRHFSEPFPARSTVVVAALAREELVVEVEAVARLRNQT